MSKPTEVKYQLDSLDKMRIVRTEDFVKKQFAEHPHFSFGDGLVMYHHSVLTKTLALQIIDSEHTQCDKLLVSIGSLLHDIGKTKDGEDEDTLHRLHESFNLPISEAFLDSLGLKQERLKALKQVVSYNSEGIELKIIKDADTLALPNDKDLYMRYIAWAIEHQLQWAIERKYKKYENLNFASSKELGKKPYTQMRKDWEQYIAIVNK